MDIQVGFPHGESVLSHSGLKIMDVGAGETVKIQYEGSFFVGSFEAINQMPPESRVSPDGTRPQAQGTRWDYRIHTFFP